MSQPITAPGITRSWPPRRPTRSQTCQPSWVCGRFSRAGQSGHACARSQAARSSGRPRRSTSRRERGDVFFLFQQQALRDVGQLERLEDRPDVEQRVDGLGARVDGVAVGVADALPVDHRPPGHRLGEDHAPAPRRRPPRAAPRRPDRCASPPSARWSAGAAAPARRARGQASAARSVRSSVSMSIRLHVVDRGWRCTCGRPCCRAPPASRRSPARPAARRSRSAAAAGRRRAR